MIPFLKTEWRNLILVNYAVDPKMLQPYVPPTTELDLYHGESYVSLVAFRFLNTKVLNIYFPLHINFTQINFRFYVRRRTPMDEWRHGAVFLREIVALPTMAMAARLLFRQPYRVMPTRYNWDMADQAHFRYAWKHRHQWNTVAARGSNEPQTMEVGSAAAFFSQRNWGYAKINQHKSLEFKVEHPRWRFYPLQDFEINVDFRSLYGNNFAFLNQQAPHSVVMAEGSAAALIPMGKVQVERADR